MTQPAMDRPLTHPPQCGDCRYRRGEGGKAVCVHRKHWLQDCVREEGKQALKMIPGPCAVVNPENNCPDYRRRLSARLADALGLRRRG
ncbi:MAG TPA: hypothetical protein PLO53_05005 [Candidatus Hydrogenedentes bacterium]|nr:hypothetical protein [Candidatus Hydrogenedentota bacterium]HPU97300.1 hypothetical protein [Candidatus Hydrogenedentota bacterium]